MRKKQVLISNTQKLSVGFSASKMDGRTTAPSYQIEPNQSSGTPYQGQPVVVQGTAGQTLAVSGQQQIFVQGTHAQPVLLQTAPAVHRENQINPAHRSETDNDHRQTPKWILPMSVTHLVLGVCSIIFQGVAYAQNIPILNQRVGWGYWCGVMFLVPGVCGIIAFKTGCREVWVRVFMVMSIFSTLFAITLIVPCAISLHDIPEYGNQDKYSYNHEYDSVSGTTRRVIREPNEYYFIPSIGWGLAGTLVSIAVLEAFVSLFSTIFCCSLIGCRNCDCCESTSAPVGMIVYQHVQPDGSSVMVSQPGLLVASPVPASRGNQMQSPPTYEESERQNT